MADTFKLPASSYEELVRIIKAYSTVKNGQSASLDDIVQSSGMIRTVISKNNGFLVELDLVSPGKTKTPTDICITLGRAYTHGIDEDAIRVWREIIENNDFLNRMISALRIRDGMDRTNFINHIIYSSGLDASKEARAGAGAIIEIMKFSGFAEEKDGKVLATSFVGTTNEAKCSPQAEVLLHVPNNTTGSNQQYQLGQAVNTKNGCQIVLNINIDGQINDLDTLGQKIKTFLAELNDTVKE